LQAANGKLDLCEPGTLKKVYSQETFKTADGKDTPLSLVKESSHEPSVKVYLVTLQDDEKNPFAAFEDLQYTIFLADGKGELSQVEFPRLGYTLIKEKDGWSVAGQKDWKVAKEQFVPHFRQQTGFLVLENDKDEKKVLFPVLPPTITLGSQNPSWSAPYKYKFPDDANRIQTVECDIVGNTLQPKDYEARFHLAKVYLEKGYLDDAEALVDQLFAKSPQKAFSPAEKQLLELLIAPPASGDTGSRSVRLRMQALSLLENNQAQFPDEEMQAANIENVKALIGQLNAKAGKGAFSPAETNFLKKCISQFETSVEPGTIALLEEAQTLLDNNKQYEDKQVDTLKIKHALILDYLKRLGHTAPIGASDEFMVLSSLLPQFAKMELPAGDDKPLDLTLIKQRVKELEACQTENSAQAPIIPPLPTPVPSVVEPMREALSVLKAVAADKDETLYLSDQVADSEEMSPAQFAANYPKEEFKPKFLLREARLRMAGATAAAVFDEASVEIGMDPTVLQQFEKMRADIAKAEQGSQLETVYTVNTAFLGENSEEADVLNLQEAALQGHLVEASTKLQSIEDTILTTMSSALLASPKAHLEFVSKRRSLPTIEELCVSAACIDYDARMEKLYPEISPTDRETLKKAIQQYLIQKQLTQHLGRALDWIDQIKKLDDKDPNYTTTRQILLNELGKSIESKRAYDFDDQFAMTFLYMETVLKIKLRKDQVANIKLFAGLAQKGDPIALQMIMGAGKTSVLQPILGYLFSALTTGGDPSALSVVVIPGFLFDKVKDELFKALGTSFNQLLRVFPYDRSLAKDPSYLRIYIREIHDAHRERSCVLMVPKQKHSILTSLNEAFYDLSENPGDIQCQERVNLISEICEFLHVNEKDQVDEIDLTMNPKVLFKYPIGKSSTVDSDRASVLSEMMLKLAEDDTLQTEVKLDFCVELRTRQNPGYVASGAQLTPELYTAKVQPRLVKYAIEIVKENRGTQFDELFPEEKQKEFLHSFLTQSTPFDDAIRSSMTPGEEKALKKSILTGKSLSRPISGEAAKRALVQQKVDYIVARTEFLKTLPEDLQQTLGACAHTITNIAPTALLKECGAHYGKDPKTGEYVSRPYEAPNAPKTTKYADPYQQVVFTTMLAMYDGIPFDAAKAMFKSLQEEAQKESEQGIAHGGAEQLFREVMTGASKTVSFWETPPKDESIEIFRMMAGKNKKTILKFLKESVYQQVKIYPLSLSSTAHALLGSSNLAVGYTGTQHVGILPLSMKGVPELGTDGKTIAAVQRKMTDKSAKTEVMPEGPGQTLAQQEIERFKADKDLFVFIDSGGWLKRENIPQYCERMLREVSAPAVRPGIKGVVYLMGEGDQWIVELQGGKAIHHLLSKSQLKTTSGEVLTIMPQKYETGTNIPQKPDAKADMSIRKGQTMRDGLQAIFRMRQILNGQKLNLLVSKETKEHVTHAIADGILANPEVKKLFDDPTLAEKALPALLKGMPKEVQDTFKAAFKAMQEKGLGNSRERIAAFVAEFNTRTEVTSDIIWRYFNVNQARAEQDKNWVAAQQKMREVVEKPLRQVLHNKTVPLEQRLFLFNHMKQFFIEMTPDDPFKAMLSERELADAETAITEKAAKYLALYTRKNASDLFTKFPALLQAINKSFDECYPPSPDERKITDLEVRRRKIVEGKLQSCVKKEDIAQMVATTDASGEEIEQETQMETEQQVEQEAEVEQEQETEMELEIHVPINPLTLTPRYDPLIQGLNDLFNVPNGRTTLSLSVGLDPEVSKIFGDALTPLSFSTNLCMRTPLLANSTRDLKFDGQFQGEYRLPATFMLAIGQGDARRYVLISDQDAMEIRKLIKRRDALLDGRWVSLISLSSGQLEDTTLPDAAQGTNTLKTDLSLDRSLAVAKLCTGNTSFSTAEVKCVEKMIDPSKGTQARDTLRTFYENVLSYQPAHGESYFTSLINKRLFRRKTAV
jgi:hypothetical protein